MAEWLPIETHAHYEVSRCGRIRRLGGRECRFWANDLGYLFVRLSQPRQVQRVHRLVARAFCPNPDNKPFVNHIDNNPANNRAENLEWCTQAENLQHMTAQGRRSTPWKNKRSPNAQLSDEAVCAIRAEYEAGYASWASLATKWNISKRAVGKLLCRETYADV